MDSYAYDGKKGLEQLLVTNVPRDLLMACEDAYWTGDQQGREFSAPFMSGHRASAAGQNKHFLINETFYEALQAHNAEPTPLRGSSLVVGRVGIFNIVRLNVPGHKWVKLKRSATRARLAEINKSLEERFVQRDFFSEPGLVSNGTIFILGVMDGVDAKGLNQLTQVMIALPAPDMKSWLYLSSMSDFLMLYEEPVATIQIDKALPKLKDQIKRKAEMAKGINGFQPARLEQVLAARQLTKGQLASLVGVAASTVTKWCKGDQAPEADTFERLASVLNVQMEWLTRAPLHSISTPLFRGNASALKAARAKLEARTAWLQEIAVLLSEFVDYPEINLPRREFRDPEEISNADIELAAEECRKLWKLGSSPIQDLVLAAEGAGIIIAREETEIVAIEGLSSWSSLLCRPMVFLSADKSNGFRSRFDLAHEIGHLILHREIPRAEDRDRHNQMEQQAHRFAGALLLPAESFSKEVRVPPNLDNLLVLKRKWGASVGAMMMRLYGLGLLTEEQKLALFKRRSARWGRKSEPHDDVWSPEEPRLMRRTIELLVTAGVLSAESLPRYLGFGPRDVERLCGLREGYFDTPSEIIELATLRRSKQGASDLNDASSARLADIVSLQNHRR